MAKTASKMVELGGQAPSFTLPDTNNGKMYSLESLRGEKATAIMFICNHCPFVKHIKDQLIALRNDYERKGINFVAISSNDVENYPDDAPEKMAEEGYPFPYLYDETQEVAQAYQATCTPDFFVFDGQLRLVYRGQLDDSRPGNGIAVTGADIREALDALLAEKPIASDQKPSMGCNIKWKAS